MINQLITNLKYALAIVITLLTPQLVIANSTEYVFSAPPEVDKQLVEIPTQETDYPFYECESEVVAETETDPETVRDSHDCDCNDCEVTSEDITQKNKLSSQNKAQK